MAAWDCAGILSWREVIAVRKVALFMVALLFGALGVFVHPSDGAENEPLAFKNYVLGSTTVEQCREMSYGIVCGKGDGVLCDDQCFSYIETIAGVPAREINFFFYDGKLEKITISLSHSYFNKVVSALKEKYGQPTEETPVKLQNRMGLPFSGTNYEWRRFANGIIRASEYASDLGTSLINYVTHHSIEEFTRRRQQSDKSGSKDL
jgi:hypothetical protein